MDKKLTDNEIIKALGCHGNAGYDQNSCDFCPILNHCDCGAKMAQNALDLINRQKAEIERLRYNLEAVLDERADHSEAYKEFAERLCEGRVSNDPVVIAVKCDLKELVGDDK